jgi:hypothetical protein
MSIGVLLAAMAIGNMRKAVSTIVRAVAIFLHYLSKSHAKISFSKLIIDSVLQQCLQISEDLGLGHSLGAPST